MSLRELFVRSERVRVLVELSMVSPKEQDLKHLQELGLDVERVIGNKIVGSIPAEKLRGLEGDGCVRALERSERLHPHSRAAGK